MSLPPRAPSTRTCCATPRHSCTRLVVGNAEVNWDDVRMLCLGDDPLTRPQFPSRFPSLHRLFSQAVENDLIPPCNNTRAHARTHTCTCTYICQSGCVHESVQPAIPPPHIHTTSHPLPLTGRRTSLPSLLLTAGDPLGARAADSMSAAGVTPTCAKSSLPHPHTCARMGCCVAPRRCVVVQSVL